MDWIRGGGKVRKERKEDEVCTSGYEKQKEKSASYETKLILFG